jgi:hypothetical protein
MRPTTELIEQLVAEAAPVRPLRPPALRAALWLLVPAAVIGGLVLWHGLRGDLGERLSHTREWLFLAGAVTTGVLAALAAFYASLPDRSRAWLLLPLPAAVLWLLTVSGGCVAAWLFPTPGAPYAGPGRACFELLLISGAPMTVAMALMLRHTRQLNASGTLAAGALAVAALTAAGMALVHPMDATALVLICDLGAAALVLAADRAAGGRLLTRRPSSRAALPPHAAPGRPR